MGDNVGFMAFRSAPDVERLKGVDGLEGFTLFKRRGHDQWYLEGPLDPPPKTGVLPEISFYEDVTYADGTVQRMLADARATIKWLGQATGDLGNGDCFNDVAIAEAMTLSRQLSAEILVVFGNDEGWDGAVRCSNGELVSGALRVIGDVLLRIDGVKRYSVIHEPKEAFDEERMSINNPTAATEAGRFFGVVEPVPHWSDVSAHEPEQYEVIASQLQSARSSESRSAASRKKGFLDHFFKR